MSEELQQKIGYDILASMPGGGGEHGDGDTVILHFSEMSAETLWTMIFKYNMFDKRERSQLRIKTGKKWVKRYQKDIIGVKPIATRDVVGGL
jgi:hypothetical protein